MKDHFFRHGPDSGPQRMNERVVAQMLVAVRQTNQIGERGKNGE